MKSESRQSFGSSSRNSVDTASLHVVKRYAPDPAIKKKQRWTRHKWWLLLSNTLLFCYGLGILLLALLTFFKCCVLPLWKKVGFFFVNLP